MRIAVTFVSGVILQIGGLFLRLNALSMSKPPRGASWGAGNWQATEWAFWQQAWSDIGNLTFLGGLLILAVAFHNWVKGSVRGAHA